MGTIINNKYLLFVVVYKLVSYELCFIEPVYQLLLLDKHEEVIGP